MSNLPSIVEALEFRREQYGISQKEWAKLIGIAQTHYSEFVNGKRDLSKKAMAGAYEFGVPADCLFQVIPVKYVVMPFKRHDRGLK